MNNYFCVLPFFGYEFTTGLSKHCCLLPKNYDINKIRADILDQKRSPFCSACWNLEDAGLISDRKLKNSALDFYWDRDIRYIEEDVRNGNYQTLMVKSSTSNTCNSTCVTCNSGLSSAWAPLERKLNIVPKKSAWITKEKIDNELNLKNLITIGFLGGEPLYEKLNFYILEKLIEYNNINCFITFTTNGSVNLDQNIKDLLKKFKNVSFNVSIDGLGSVFEYMRFPLKWDILLDNLEFFRTITDNNSVSYTISNVNVLYHHATVEWFKKENLNYHLNPILKPSHFRPSALPRTVKEYILKKFVHSKDLEFFIGSPHTEQDDKDFYKMLDQIKLQDQVKNISIKNYLPELCDLIFTL